MAARRAAGAGAGPAGPGRRGGGGVPRQRVGRDLQERQALRGEPPGSARPRLSSQQVLYDS